MPITTVPNGCDPAFNISSFPKLVGDGKASNRHAHFSTLLYAGTLGRVNDIDYLVALANELKVNDIPARIVIYGDGKERQRLISESQRLRLSADWLVVRDPVPKSEMPAIFAAATLGISTVLNVPELFANSANKVFDSLAAGRPVLINHEGWLASLLRDTKAGMVLSLDPAFAALQISQLISDPGRLAMMQVAARSLSMSRFARESQTAVVAGILESLHTAKTDSISARKLLSAA